MIVLAGGIGSGKSMVARILRLRGYGVYDCDYEARLLMENDPSLVGSLVETCGEEIYKDGRLDRKKLAKLIFSNPDLRDKINSLVHHAVRDSVRVWLASDPSNIFVETAIAAQSGLAAEAEGIWWITASFDTRMKRIRERDDRSEAEILRIMEAQSMEAQMINNLSDIPVTEIVNDHNTSLLEIINDLALSI